MPIAALSVIQIRRQSEHSPQQSLSKCHRNSSEDSAKRASRRVDPGTLPRKRSARAERTRPTASSKTFYFFFCLRNDTMYVPLSRYPIGLRGRRSSCSLQVLRDALRISPRSCDTSLIPTCVLVHKHTATSTVVVLDGRSESLAVQEGLAALVEAGFGFEVQLAAYALSDGRGASIRYRPEVFTQARLDGR